MIASSNLSPFNRNVLGTPVQVQRPNNAVAYAANQVYGDGVDARFQFVAPAAQPDMATGLYTTMGLGAWQTRSPGDTALSLFLFLFSAQPTLLKDQDSFTLSDADIAALYPGQNSLGGTVVGTSAANGTAGLNRSAGGAGRRAVAAGTSIQAGFVIAPGTIIYALLKTDVVYNPLALEAITFQPTWQYLAVPTS